MGLFSKEICVICGETVGALKKRKLADGVMCTDCTKGLSPFFSDRKGSTVADIKAQLEDREQNRERLKTFTATKAFGESGVILIDQEQGLFCALGDTSDGLLKSAKTVTSIQEIADRNPDVLGISQIMDLDVDIVETTREEKQTVDGQQRSFNPRHITYMYAFTLILKVDHPYIETIRIPLNSSAVQIPNEGERLRDSLGSKFTQWLLNTPETSVRAPEVCDCQSLKDYLSRNPYQMPDYSYGFKCTQRNWSEIKRYEYYLQMGAAIKGALFPEA